MMTPIFAPVWVYDCCVYLLESGEKKEKVYAAKKTMLS